MLLPLQQNPTSALGASSYFLRKGCEQEWHLGGFKQELSPNFGTTEHLKTSSSCSPVFAPMDVNGRIGVKDALLALLLAVLQGCPLGETAPNPSPLVGSNWGNPRRYIHLQTSTDMSNFYLEIRLDGTVRKSTARTSYSEKSSSLLSEKILLST